MASVKTAISIQESLFEQVEAAAQELEISRSRLFVLAAEAFLQRHENQKLLQAINAAYEDQPEAGEVALQRRQRAGHRRRLEGEW